MPRFVATALLVAAALALLVFVPSVAAADDVAAATLETEVITLTLEEGGSIDAVDTDDSSAESGFVEPDERLKLGYTRRPGPWAHGRTPEEDKMFFFKADTAATAWIAANAKKQAEQKEAEAASSSTSSSSSSDDSDASDDDDDEAKAEAAKRKERREQRKAQRDAKNSRKGNEATAGLGTNRLGLRRKIVDGRESLLKDKVAVLTKDGADLRRSFRAHLRGRMTTNNHQQYGSLRSALAGTDVEEDNEIRNQTTIAEIASAGVPILTLPLTLFDIEVMQAFTNDIRPLLIDAKSVDAELEKAVDGRNTRETKLLKKAADKNKKGSKSKDSKEKDEAAAPAVEAELPPPDYASWRQEIQRDLIEPLNQMKTILASHEVVHQRIIDASLMPISQVLQQATVKKDAIATDMNANDESTKAKSKELKQLKKMHKEVAVLVEDLINLNKALINAQRRRRALAMSDVVNALTWMMRGRRGDSFAAEDSDGKPDRLEVLAYNLFRHAPMQSLTSATGIYTTEFVKLMMIVVLPGAFFGYLVQPLLLVAFNFYYGGVIGAPPRSFVVKFFAFPKTAVGVKVFHLTARILTSTIGTFVSVTVSTAIYVSIGQKLVAAVADKTLAMLGRKLSSPLFEDSHPLFTMFTFTTSTQLAVTVGMFALVTLLQALLLARPRDFARIQAAAEASVGRKLGH